MRQVVLVLVALAAAPVEAEPASTTAASAPVLAARDLASELGKGRPIAGDEAPHYVAFTFDDGPSYKTTPIVLAALARYDVPAAFFVVGHRFAGKGKVARQNAAVLVEEARAGYLIGNHTFDHVNLKTQDDAAMQRAIDHNGDVIARVIGARPALFRSPYGATSPAAARYLASKGMTRVAWSVDQLDFQIARRKHLRARIDKEITDEQGGVVLMHDTKPWTAATVAGILDDLEAANCKRLDDGEAPIVPVTLHYFIRERDGTPRPVPAAVEQATKEYVRRLPERCQARPSVDKPAEAN